MATTAHKLVPGRLQLWKLALLPLMASVILLSYLWAQDLPNFPDPATARIIFWHVPMAILSMVWFFAAAWYSGRYLVRGRAFDDIRASRAAEVGLLLTLLATLTGAVFSKMQWAGGLRSPWYYGYWQWDPKQIAITIVIAIYMAYFGLRMSLDEGPVRARISAAYAVLGGVAVPFLYYVLPHLPVFSGTVHPQDVLTSREGMDDAYRMVFRLATIGFLGISIWIYQLQLRKAALLERARERREESEAAVRIEAVRAPRAGDAPVSAPGAAAGAPVGAGRDV